MEYDQVVLRTTPRSPSDSIEATVQVRRSQELNFNDYADFTETARIRVPAA